MAFAERAGVRTPAGRLRVVGKGSKERECIVIPRLGRILADYLRDVRPRLVALPVHGSLSRPRPRHSFASRLRENGVLRGFPK